MEIILVLAVVAFLLVKFAKPRSTAPAEVPPVETKPRTVVEVRSTVRPPVNQTPPVSADSCWVTAGSTVTVAKIEITGGLLYVGRGLKSVSGYRTEPALIDPLLAVERSQPDRHGLSLTYWPSYDALSPPCRAAYLEWLSTGRQYAKANIGYVFLYFYGLERRALADSLHSPAAKTDIPAIFSEVERLLTIYGGHDSFHRYATQFLEVLEATHPVSAKRTPPMERHGRDLPVSLRVALARIATHRQPLPPDWALRWFWTHPETSIRPTTRRCAKEFAELFRIRYAQEFGDGLRVRARKTPLRIDLTPASASFGSDIQISTGLPDVADTSDTFSRLRQLGETCAADLEAYGRWLGRNPDSPTTIAAVALLPAELVSTNNSQEAQKLWAWLDRTLGTHDLAACTSDDLLSHCASFGAGKLAKSESVLLAQLLEKGGYGIEPDVRFGGATLSPGGTVVLFRVRATSNVAPSPEYAGATVLLHLAVAVAAADGSISASEERHLTDHLQRSMHLGYDERHRLSAHLAWLMKSPPSLAGLKRRLEPLLKEQRLAIADFVVSVAGADGQISAEEIRTLGKLYPLLGLDADAVYEHVHAMSAGLTAPSASTGPVPVIASEPANGYSIPKPPTAAPAVQLDMKAVHAKLAESAHISAILSDIFTDEEAEPVVVAPPTGQGKMQPTYRGLLEKLVARDAWSRGEFDAIAADCRVLPDAAIDILNENAFDIAGAPLLDGDDPLIVDHVVAKELLT